MGYTVEKTGEKKKPDSYAGFPKKEEKMNMPLTQVSALGPIYQMVII